MKVIPDQFRGQHFIVSGWWASIRLPSTPYFGLRYYVLLRHGLPDFLTLYIRHTIALVDAVLENLTSSSFNSDSRLPLNMHHLSTHASSWRPRIDTAKKIKMHEASIRRMQKDVNDDTSVWADLLNRDGDEVQNDEIHSNMEQTETLTMTKGNSKVGVVVPSYTEIELVVVSQVARTTDQVVPK